MKRRNFLAVQSNCKKPEEKAHGSDMDYKEKARVERKLNGHRQKYQVSRANRSPTWGEMFSCNANNFESNYREVKCIR